MSRRPPALPLLAAALLLTTAPPVQAGPPWISIELPANPLDRTTRGAFLLIHTFHHDRASHLGVEAKAIGVVDGRRREILLDLGRTSREGVLALRRTWPEKGTWLLVITVQDGHGGATALVGVGADGDVRSVRVPSRAHQDFQVPRPVTPDDIDAALRSMARGTERDSRSAPLLAVALGALLAVPAWSLSRLRRPGR